MQLLDLGTLLPNRSLAAILGLDPQLLLGVLPLLDAANLQFALGQLLPDSALFVGGLL